MSSVRLTCWHHSSSCQSNCPSILESLLSSPSSCPSLTLSCQSADVTLLPRLSLADSKLTSVFPEHLFKNQTPLNESWSRTCKVLVAGSWTTPTLPQLPSHSYQICPPFLLSDLLRGHDLDGGSAAAKSGLQEASDDFSWDEMLPAVQLNWRHHKPNVLHKLNYYLRSFRAQRSSSGGTAIISFINHTTELNSA